ncbi:MAG: hypothetical protein LBT33_10625 [Spirochaetia bacterium]|jgi:hypothetical protein|nr:hypothetical protein [Spirochaetia bacterium]
MMNKYGKETSGPGILNYHSSHEERIASSPRLAAELCAQDRRPRGILGRLLGKNKGLRLTFINVVALMLLGVLYQMAVAHNPAGTWRSGAFRFSFSAFARGEQAFVSLRITKEKNEIPGESPPEVIFRSAGVSETFTPGLPLNKAETAYVRAVMPLQGGGEPRKVFCRIVFGGKAKDLTALVKEE